jgi:membrane-bound metal-dependent hydrolase YbcI (DUF457 family)
MAGTHQHVTVSTLLGVGYGAGAVWGLGFEPAHGALAGTMTALGGLLPDLDLPTSIPVRELFGFTAALVPLLLLERLIAWAGSPEAIVLGAAGIYLLVRYGGAWVLDKLTIHRGMFHSMPAAIIVAELVFLVYHHPNVWVRALPAVGIFLGFCSHLVLDELYSVRVRGVGVRLAKSAGSALKWRSSSAAANFVTYLLLAAASYAVCLDQGVVDRPAWAQRWPVLQRDVR